VTREEHLKAERGKNERRGKGEMKGNLNQLTDER